MKPSTYNPADYWTRRYLDGRTSGAGSEGDAAIVKAAKIDAVIAEHDITSVIDWGVGDGVVLGHMKAKIPYLGLDVAPVAVERLRARYGPRSRTKRFALASEGAQQVRDLALSLDVLFHLIDDADYDLYLAQLFGSATKAVLIHANDHDGGRTARHVLWRHWTPDVAARFGDWRLVEAPADRTVPGFFLYLRGDALMVGLIESAHSLVADAESASDAPHRLPAGGFRGEDGGHVVGGELLRVSAADVHGVGDKLKVFRVHTRGNSAEVIWFEPFRDRAMCLLVERAVREDDLAGDSDAPVALSVERSLPDLAGGHIAPILDDPVVREASDGAVMAVNEPQWLAPNQTAGFVRHLGERCRRPASAVARAVHDDTIRKWGQR